MTINPISPSNSPQRAYPTKQPKQQPGMAPIHVPAPSKYCPVYGNTAEAQGRATRGWINL